MKAFWRRIGWGYAVLSIAAFSALAAAAAAGAWLVPERVRGAAAVLAGAEIVGGGEARAVARDREALNRRIREFEEGRVKREAEMLRLEEAGRSALARSELLHRDAERIRRDAEAAQAAAARAAGDAAFESNVNLLARMDPDGAGSVMQAWDDATVAVHLRALRPSKAAELLDALRQDPAWRERLPRILAPSAGK